MGKLFTGAERAARIGGTVAVVALTFAGASAGAAPPESNVVPKFEATDAGTGSSRDLPVLPEARPPALQLLWFDPARALSPGATTAVGEEVRSIFRDLGVDVDFRLATPDTSYGAGPALEIPIILLRDDPVVARRPSHVLGLVVPHQEPSRAVWAFLDNVGWTLGQDPERPLPVGGECALGRAIGRVVAHEVIHSVAPDEPHSRNGLMGHSMSRAFLLGDHAPLDARCRRAFLSRLAARAPGDGPAAGLASIR